MQDKKLREVNKKVALTQMLKTIGGRAYLHDLILEGNLNTKYGSMSCEEANYRNGRRYMGLTVQESIKKINPEILIKMEQEANE